MNGRACTGRQFALPERLHQEIVSALFDFRQGRRQSVVRGDYDDWNVAVQRVLPQRPGDLDAGHVGSSQIHQDKVECLGRRLPQCGHAVGNGFTCMAIATESNGHGLAKPCLVFDQQDARIG
jgi:hypothetical protein